MRRLWDTTKKLTPLLIVASLLMSLAAIALAQDGEPDHVVPQGYFERCWGEDRDRAECVP